MKCTRFEGEKPRHEGRYRSRAYPETKARSGPGLDEKASCRTLEAVERGVLQGAPNVPGVRLESWANLSQKAPGFSDNLRTIRDTTFTFYKWSSACSHETVASECKCSQRSVQNHAEVT